MILDGHRLRRGQLLQHELQPVCELFARGNVLPHALELEAEHPIQRVLRPIETMPDFGQPEPQSTESDDAVEPFDVRRTVEAVSAGLRPDGLSSPMASQWCRVRTVSPVRFASSPTRSDPVSFPCFVATETG